MTAQQHTAELAQLRAEIAALRAKVDQPRRRFPRRVLPLALVALHVALLPLSLLAAGPVFSDLPTAAPVHQPNIQAIGDAGITTGFEDPAHPGQRLYNPKDNVTREEMASFLARTAGLGGYPPVVNALTATNANAAISANHATSADTATTATTATSADNAATVGGYAPGGLVRVAHATGTNIGNFTTTCFIYSTLAQASLTAPTAGYLLVTGAAVTANQGGVGRRDFFLRTRVGADFSPASTAVADSSQATAATTWVFPVAAGAQTIYLEGCGNVFSGSQTISVASPQLTALFIPFGSTGTSAP